MKRAANPMRQSWLDGDEDGGWIPLRLALKMSPAWLRRPIPVVRLLDRIEIEHLRHGGAHNGHLCVSYPQFVEAGVSRKVVLAAIKAAVDLGLLEMRQSDVWAGNIKAPNEYRLTYVPERNKRAPTDEWKAVTEDMAKATAAEFQLVAAAKATAAGKTKPPFPFGPPPSSLSAQKADTASSLSDHAPVPSREQPLISAVNLAKPAAQRAPKSAVASGGRAPEPILVAYRIGEQPPVGTKPVGPVLTSAPDGTERQPAAIGDIARTIVQRGLAHG